MNDRECLRTSTNVWRSLCDHCELMANCIRKPIRHTFATGETSIIFETPHERPRMLTNNYECLAIICDHYELMANCIRKLIPLYIRHSVRLAWGRTIYTIIILSVCRRSQTAGRHFCSIVSGDVSNCSYRLTIHHVTSSCLSSA